MKKKPVIIAIVAVLAVVIAVAIVLIVRSAGSKDAAPPKEGESITLDTAVIKDADSIALIESYEPSELGLEGTWEDYDWVAHKSDGVYIAKGEFKGYYVRVEVGSKNVNEDGTFTVEVAGVYLISYDGETLLSYDQANDTYTRIKEVHDIPEVTLPGETAAATTEAAE